MYLVNTIHMLESPLGILVFRKTIHKVKYNTNVKLFIISDLKAYYTYSQHVQMLQVNKIAYTSELIIT